MKKSECPPEILTHNAISVYIEGQVVTFLLENDNIGTAPLEMVESALPQIENCKIEEHLLNKCNPTLTVKRTSKDNKTIAIKFL